MQTLHPGESAVMIETIECLTIAPPPTLTPDALRTAIEKARGDRLDAGGS